MIQDCEFVGAELERAAHQVPGHGNGTRQFEKRSHKFET
jgi:hypothetical protein